MSIIWFVKLLTVSSFVLSKKIKQKKKGKKERQGDKARLRRPKAPKDQKRVPFESSRKQLKSDWKVERASCKRSQ